MVDKKRGVKAKCANALKASEVMAQRRAAEAEAKAQAVAAEAEAQSQAEAEAQAETQADAGAYEAEALQTDLKHREQQLADKERLHQLQQQLQDLQRSELQRKEQQLAVLVVKQQAAVRQWEQQVTGQQHSRPCLLCRQGRQFPCMPTQAPTIKAKTAVR
ncbi:hypothetical protein QJQ45_006153 [Haematococcus lacustris]|nr:hypothetical protein QJQ45_006153 [Haematococcus lacustris]